MILLSISVIHSLTDSGLNPILAPGYMGVSGTDDIAADDSELEEGEVSPPRSEMPPDIKFGKTS